MDSNLIIVTGFLGAPTEDFAKSIATESGYALLSLDEEIVKKDGRSISRICMMVGEHAYRNNEYEILDMIDNDASPFMGDAPGLVIACGDGLLYDELSRDIALKHKLIIVGGDMDEEELWAGACQIENSYHAFMNFGTDEEKYISFKKFIGRQKNLFESINQEAI